MNEEYNEYIARRLYINRKFYLINFEDFLYLTNYWGAWFEDYGKWDKGEQEERKFANFDKIVAQSLEEDRIDRTDRITE